MDWKKKLYLLGVVLLCTGVLASFASADNPSQQIQSKKQALSNDAGVKLKAPLEATPQVPSEFTPQAPKQETASAKVNPAVLKPDEDQRLAEEQKLLEENGGKLLPVDESMSATSISPLGGPRDGEPRAGCVGDKDINGAGTTAFNYLFNAYWASRRVTSIYTASEFGCTEGGPISAIKFYVSVLPTAGYPFTNFQIAVRHTATTNYTSPYCFTAFPADWTVVYASASQAITSTGWNTFTFTTPFIYNGVDNLEVDVSWGKNPSDSGNSGSIWGYTASPTPRTIYGYTDSVAALPPTWACAVSSLYIYSSTVTPRCQFVFPPPSTGACCVDYNCVATNSNPECTALGGTWYGGLDCSTFVCPPWNDNCSAVAPVTLEPGTPVTFTGTTLGATNDPGACSFTAPQVWVGFTLPAVELDSFFDVFLDYCGSGYDGLPFGNAQLNAAVGCPCTSITAAATYDTTTCGDGNVSLLWKGLSSGTYYYPVMLDAGNHAAGPYSIHVSTARSYCASGATSTADETIKNVTLGTINNTTTDCDKYNDFTAISTVLQRGSTYPFSLTIGDCEGTSCYSKRAVVYIDWNQDYDFTDAGEQAWYSGATAIPSTPCPEVTVTGNIVVPIGANLGATRMRVIVQESASAAPLSCGTFSWGGTEDYTVIIDPAPPTGACCFGVSCQDSGTWTQQACETAGGRYAGDGSLCTPNPCIGACCFLPAGTCEDTETEAACLALGGNFHGAGTDCATTVCPTAGDTCGSPFPVSLPAELPFNNDNTTCGRLNDYADTCLGSYDGGEDIIYQLVVTEDVCLKVTMTTTSTWTGLSIDDSCPGDPTTCLYKATNTGAGGVVIDNVLLQASVGVYYIMIDTWPSPACIPTFHLLLEACPTGACCIGEACSIMSPAACTAAGGAYFGNDSLCDPGLCLLRACCLPDGTCQDLSDADCATAGGVYHATQICANTICNDNCADALPVVSGAPAATGNNCTATDDGSASCQSNSHKDLWYKWVATCDGTVTMDTEGSALSDTVLSVYTACGGTQVACDDDSGTGTWSLLTFGCITDVEYVIRVASYSTGCGGFNLNISVACLPQGACCLAGIGTLGCEAMYQTQCNALGGSYAGNGTVCSGQDCVGEGSDNVCEILAGAPDCQLNGVPDSCEIIAGTSHDWDGDGMPDECQPDCNNNGFPDFCDVPTGCSIPGCVDAPGMPACGQSLDCQPDAIPDECQLGALRTDLVVDGSFEGGTPSPAWAEASTNFGTPLCDAACGSGAGSALPRTGAWWCWFGGAGSTGVFPEVGSVTQTIVIPSGGATLEFYLWMGLANDSTSFVRALIDGNEVVKKMADDPAYSTGYALVSVDVSAYADGGSHALMIEGQQTVYGAGATNMNVDDVALNTGGGGGGGGDCNGNGIPDFCDLRDHPADPIGADCNQNLVIDTCEWFDCNGNGVLDACDILNGESLDCNNNGVPDECDLSSGFSLDCNGNQIPDECDLATGLSQDCNGNHLPDECDIANCTPGDLACADCQGDGIPDGCQLNDTGRDLLSYDDGSSEDALGNSYYAHEIIWIHHFTIAGSGTLSEIQTVFGNLGSSTSGVAAGDPFNVYVWSDPNGDGSPADGVVLATAAATADGGSIATDVFQTVAIPPTAVDTSFFIGVGYLSAGGFAAPMDTDGTLAHQSWIAYTVTPPIDPNNFGATLYNNDTAGFPANWMLRATISFGAPANDCNENGIPDECDIQVAFDGFCDGTVYPPCDTDYNLNGVPDHCEICGDFTSTNFPPYGPPDGLVNDMDYWYIHDGLGYCAPHAKYTEHQAADMDADGCITLIDYQNWVMCYRMANGKDFKAPKFRPAPPKKPVIAAPASPAQLPAGGGLKR
jgi:hypothetical protein